MQKRFQMLLEGFFFILLYFVLTTFLPDEVSTVGLILIGIACTATSFSLDTLYNHKEVRTWE